ncbi:sarcoplasmic calcium-binding proteins I, III, and IV [Lingula anatina]|uniref:Sarcoplasmic calcium-binding proteins I, III, and IV n=1 Tax=Lingula anatina TaxID=7574 RepID=A0A1S3KF38_LINAN|nr:sarcoplasmic calcium-binding proteins I, III, and IV [Lingula anatina]XP_013420865.1 sarcoplasmic calcium-binding proteins I, III, and IV [Lingula anatina]|eukprot:XP_013420856.1 sarcoplasmic calcium-binding proteins I, III, and IV [Lingula anatina]
MGDFKLSEFQKKKLRHVFDIFYDINKDGVIEWKDFKIAIEKICDLHGWPQGREKHTTATETMQEIWKALLKYADKNKDKKVSTEEWYLMWTESIKASKNTGALPDWVNRYREFMFYVNDTSGDDIIDMNEYKTVYKSYGITDADCESAFNKFSENQAVKITKDEFAELFMEYFVSDDPNAKGNALFGKTNF